MENITVMTFLILAVTAAIRNVDHIKDVIAQVAWNLTFVI